MTASMPRAFLALGVGSLGVGSCRCVAPRATCPIPSLIHGKAIGAPELPVGTVTVRVVRESIGNNIAGQLVTLTSGSTTREAKTDDQGRANFPNLPPGVEARAEAVVNGERLVSDPFSPPCLGRPARHPRRGHEGGGGAQAAGSGRGRGGAAGQGRRRLRSELARDDGVSRRLASGVLRARDPQQRAGAGRHRRTADSRPAIGRRGRDDPRRVLAVCDGERRPRDRDRSVCVGRHDRAGGLSASATIDPTSRSSRSGRPRWSS